MNEEGEDMLSKANAKIEFFWAVRSEVLAFFHRKTVRLDYFEALSSVLKRDNYLMRTTYQVKQKSGKIGFVNTKESSL